MEKEDIKTDKKAIINKDNIASKYIVDNKPVKITVYFYEEDGSLKYSFEKPAENISFKEEWFEFTRPNWRIKNVINSNSVYYDITGKVGINPFLFETIQIMFLLKNSSIELGLEYGSTLEGIGYIANVNKLFGINEQTAISGTIIEAIKEAITKIY